MYKKLIYFLSKVINVCNRVATPLTGVKMPIMGGGCLRPKNLTMTPTQPVQICIHFWFLVHSATGSLPTACQSLKTSQKQCPRPLPMLTA